MLPWLSVVLFGARRAWVDGVPNALGFSWQRFALSWAAFVFVFFSVSGSKLPSYILPMFPPLALVVGWLLVRLDTRSLLRYFGPLVVIGPALALLLFVGYDRAVPLFAGERVPVEMLISFGEWLKAAATVSAIGGIVLVIALRKETPKARFAGFAVQVLTILAGLQLAIAGFEALSPIRSSSAILRTALKAEGSIADAPFYQVGMYDQTVPFYLQRPTRLVDYRQELSLGIDAEPQKQVPTLQAWIAEWKALPRGYALMDPQVEPPLREKEVPKRVLARDARRVVVSRQ
jgi:4-amino-4-deoxy-L-arabinose transferase-like glycosyltransferase